MKSMKNKKNIGKNENKDLLDSSYLDKKNHKVKITMWLDGDLLSALKEQANDIGAGYQTLAHKILKDAITKKESFATRLEKLESIVLKKHG